MMPMMLLRPEEDKKKDEGEERSDSLPSAGSRPTCRHEENPGTQQDGVPFAVEASEADADAARHEQDGAEDGEEA